MIVNYSDQPVIKGKKSIFLAGPTSRSKEVASWRNLAIEGYKKLDFDGVLYVPESSNGEPKKDYNDQVDWEIEALQNATIIIFWLPREKQMLPGFTTNVEFGEWFKDSKTLYGRPDNAQKVKYLDIRYEKERGMKPINSFKELLIESMKLSNKLYEKEANISC